MKRKTTLILTSVILLVTFGLSCKKVDKSDPKWREERLKERVNIFQQARIDGKPEKMWDVALKSVTNKEENAKEGYMASAKKDSHMSSYNSVTFLIDGIEFKGDKAKVDIKFFIKISEDAKPMEADMYDFWEFVDGDWYYDFGGRNMLSAPEDW